MKFLALVTALATVFRAKAILNIPTTLGPDHSLAGT